MLLGSAAEFFEVAVEALVLPEKAHIGEVGIEYPHRVMRIGSGHERIARFLYRLKVAWSDVPGDAGEGEVGQFTIYDLRLTIPTPLSLLGEGPGERAAIYDSYSPLPTGRGAGGEGVQRLYGQRLAIQQKRCIAPFFRNIGSPVDETLGHPPIVKTVVAGNRCTGYRDGPALWYDNCGIDIQSKARIIEEFTLPHRFDVMEVRISPIAYIGFPASIRADIVLFHQKRDGIPQLFFSFPDPTGCPPRLQFHQKQSAIKGQHGVAETFLIACVRRTNV